MPSEEGKQVLKLLAEGKIDADQAYRLLRAIGDVEEKRSGRLRGVDGSLAEEPQAYVVLRQEDVCYPRVDVRLVTA